MIKCNLLKLMINSNIHNKILFRVSSNIFGTGECIYDEKKHV